MSWWKGTLDIAPPLTAGRLQANLRAIADIGGGPDWSLCYGNPPSDRARLVGLIPIGDGCWIVQFVEPKHGEESGP